MLDVKGFFDYCINERCLGKNYESTIKLLYDLGYRTIAINHTLDANDLEQKKKKKKGEVREAPTDPVPEPYKIAPVPGCEDMTVLNRLTVVFSNQEVLHKITKSPVYKKYDIIGVLPTTFQATLVGLKNSLTYFSQFVCSNFDGDILCFDPESKNHVKRSRKMYKQLMERGYHFEIPYSPAIEDTTKRKNIIHTSHLYHTFIKSKNVIVSSAASDATLIRGPYDVINLGLIFGLNELQAKNAIGHCGRQVFINSVGRRHGKAVAFVENIEKDSKGPELEKASDSVICLTESDEDVMEVDEPATKKVKQ